MRCREVLLTSALWLAVVPQAPAAPASAPHDVRAARPAARFDPASRCPQLQQTAIDDPAAALVVMAVSASGAPSQASIRSDSSDDRLNAAALACVAKLRFQAPTLPGEGTPVASWQQIAFTWASSPAPQAPAPHGAPAVAAGAAATQLRVCVDDAGRLLGEPAVVRSSGDPALDAAALAIARSGSGHYRAGTAPGAPAAPCMRLSLGPDPQGSPPSTVP